MTKERNATKAGIFILISIVLIFAIMVSITGLSGFQPSQTLTVSFTLADDIGGLRVGDDVRIGGFKVGVVRDIEVVKREQVNLPPGATTKPIGVEPVVLRVTFTMPKKYVVYEGAQIGIGGSVTGQSWVNFSSLGLPQQPQLQDAVALVGKPGPLSSLMSALGDTGPQILNQVNTQTVPAATHMLVSARTETLARVNQTVDTLRTETLAAATGTLTDVRTQTVPRVNGILDDVRGQTVPKANKAADSADRMMVNIGDTFGESKNDFKGTMANLNAATGSVKEKIPGILEQVSAAMTKVDTAVTSATEALTNARDATGTLKNVLGGNKGKLDGMIASLKATGDNLKGASAEIRRSPWRLLYKPAKGEMGNLNIYDSARSFAEGANDLNDAAQALRDAINSKQDDPDAMKALMERVEKSFAKFTTVEKTLWEQVRE